MKKPIKVSGNISITKGMDINGKIITIIKHLNDVKVVGNIRLQIVHFSHLRVKNGLK